MISRYFPSEPGNRLGFIIIQIVMVMTALVLSGCDDEGREPGVSRGVIDARFSSGGYPEVVFSRSVVPQEGGSLADIMINWGKVTISDGTREVILTGRMDDSLIPPFRYYSQEIKGEPGKTYVLRAKFGDIDVSAVGRMPWPTPIDSISVAPADNDTLRSATLYFTSPRDVPAYYWVSLRPESRGGMDMPCVMGCVRVDNPGRKVAVPVLRPRQRIDSADYTPQFKPGESFTVSLNRVEKEVYEFWNAYDNMNLFSQSPFISTDQSLPGNITSGYGVFSVQGSSSRRLEIP